ncbi:hypothetical protein [Microbacterium oleivorans]|nr:hypothetical protein [Microbacterium oleivorans]
MRTIVVVSSIILIVGAVVSGIWQGLSGPTGEPAWISVVENMTWP